VNESHPEIPAFCPVCEVVIASSMDEDAISSVNCCRECETSFFEVNREKWQNGWRPSRDEIKSSLNSRLFIVQ